MTIRHAKNFIKKWRFIFIYLLLYFVVINLVTAHRFWQFDAFYFDHAIYDQAIWNVAHFKAPLIDHLEDGIMNQMGDHFTPTMYLFTPIYWFTSSYIPILIAQNLLVIISAFFLFLIAKDKIKNNLMIFSLVFAYTLFLGLQNALISNLHADIFVLPTLSITLYFLEKRKWRYYWIFYFLTLGVKETFLGLGVCLGLYLFFKKEYKRGIITILASGIYYLIVINVIMPYLAHRPYAYIPNRYSLFVMIEQLFFPLMKTKTLILSFANFGFLPLINIYFLPVIIQDYFLRFVISNTSARWDLGLHYNITPALLLAYGAITGVSILSKNKIYKKYISLHAILIILLVLFMHQKFHGPLGLSYNPAFYPHTKELDFLRDFLSEIPAKGLVMTQNNLAPQLTHTHNVMLLRDSYWEWMPETIAIDIRSGQNANNYWPLPPFNFEKFYLNLINDPNYVQKKTTNEQILFLKRTNPDMNWYK